jgi:hypothetical protein
VRAIRVEAHWRFRELSVVCGMLCSGEIFFHRVIQFPATSYSYRGSACWYVMNISLPDMFFFFFSLLLKFKCDIENFIVPLVWNILISVLILLNLCHFPFCIFLIESLNLTFLLFSFLNLFPIFFSCIFYELSIVFNFIL